MPTPSSRRRAGPCTSAARPPGAGRDDLRGLHRRAVRPRARNLVAALHAAGGQPDDLVSLQIFVTDLAAYRASMSELGSVWRTHSGAATPPWRCSGRRALRPERPGRIGRHRRHHVSATYAHLTAAHRQLLARSEALARDVLARSRTAVSRAGSTRARCALSIHGLVPEVLERGREVPALNLCLVREGLARYSTAAETAFALQGLGAHPIWRPVGARSSTPGSAGRRGRSGRRLRAHRADADPTWRRWRSPRARRRRVPPQRREGVHLQRAGCRHLHGLRADHRWCRLPGHHRFAVHGRRGAFGRPDPVRRRPPDRPAAIRRRRGACGERHRRDRPRFRRCDADPRPLPSQRRRCAVGMAQAALDAAVAHAAERQAFGHPLSALQGVSHQLADVATRVQASRLLVHSAAAAHDAGSRRTPRPLRWRSSSRPRRRCWRSTLRSRCMAPGPSSAASPGAPLPRRPRTRIYEGASEVQREIIARQLFRRAVRGS